MQFIVTGYDLPDALPRRLEVRQQHIDLCGVMKAKGEMLYGVALVDDAGQMKGSLIILDLPDRAAVDAYLKVEPYIANKVWGKVEVVPCKVGPSFVSK
jgi:uncharacterized protein